MLNKLNVLFINSLKYVFVFDIFLNIKKFSDVVI